MQANGFGWVRYLVTRDDKLDGHLVAACRRAGVKVWYATIGNGVYDTGDLPPGWERWKMRHRDANPPMPGFTYLCINHPEYRRWKKARVIEVVRRFPFDGMEVMEAFWPAYRGPENPLYGCICNQCVEKFKATRKAGAIPDFVDQASPNHYRTNRALYEQWIEFRAESVAEWLDDLINGPGGVRAARRGIKVGVWGIADDIPDAVATLKEWEGIDGAMIAARVKPDLYVIQTDWPDWMKPQLKPDYVTAYAPFVEAVRSAGSKVAVHVQTDIGSNEKCRRDFKWLDACIEAGRTVGLSGVVPYEYHLALDMYRDEPQVRTVRLIGNTVQLTFSQRLDATIAARPENYTLDRGKVHRVDVDGNLVRLGVLGRPTKVTIANLANDPTRRFFKKHAAIAISSGVTVPLQGVGSTTRR